MNVKLLTDHHLEFLSLKGSCTGLSEFTLVKMPHCWKLHAAAHIIQTDPSIDRITRVPPLHKLKLLNSKLFAGEMTNVWLIRLL